MSDKRFKGWYYKQRSGDYMLAFIPGVASDGAFVQVIDPSGTKSFPMPYLFAAGDTVYTGNCVFSPSGVRVSLPGISGTLRYGKNTPLSSDIMGPFACLPMQCRHGVVSMDHTVNGRILKDGRQYIFRNGSGYIEKDSGRSFPRSYLWLQCNDFSAPCSFMFSLAHIPFAGTSFTGCICALMYRGKEYRFATYRGVKVRRFGNRLRLRQGKFLLDVFFSPLSSGHSLQAPLCGRMSESIRESCDAYLHIRLRRAGCTIVESKSRRATCEERTGI